MQLKTQAAGEFQAVQLCTFKSWYKQTCWRRFRFKVERKEERKRKKWQKEGKKDRKEGRKEERNFIFLY